MTATIYAHRYAGHCHCGSVRFHLLSDHPPDDLVLRVCRCSFCLRHRPRYWSDPSGSLEVELADPQAIERYRFGHRTADFVFCRGCGVFCFALAEIGGALYAVTNMNLWLDRDATPRETFLEALQEEEPERTARRRRNWTPVATPLP